MADVIKIGALISGTGTNLRAIIDACNAGKLAGKVVFIGSDNPQAAGLKLGRRHGIPTFVTDYQAIIRSSRDSLSGGALPLDVNLNELLEKQNLFPTPVDLQKVTAFLKSRVTAESRLLKAMAPYDVDLLVLAGYMRTLTPYFIDRVNTDAEHPRIMNIHPALLPAFPGTDGYGDAFRFGCKVAGCTVHFVDYGEDTGPIIGQKAFPIDKNDTLDTVREKGLKLEWVLYPECIDLFAQGRLKIVEMTYDRPGRRQKMKRTVVRILTGRAGSDAD
ncbi:MAG: phosphoribosylglycinamide formyltransferase [Desulfobacterales bacterium]|jgi:phosphoribosylglycinamide formyltransferase-1